MSTTLYVVKNLQGRVMYVGVSADALRRAREHASAKDWFVHEASSLEMLHFEDQREARDAERLLIAALRPPGNIAGIPSSPLVSSSAPAGCPAQGCPGCPDCWSPTGPDVAYWLGLACRGIHEGKIEPPGISESGRWSWQDGEPLVATPFLAGVVASAVGVPLEEL